MLFSVLCSSGADDTLLALYVKGFNDTLLGPYVVMAVPMQVFVWVFFCINLWWVFCYVLVWPVCLRMA